MRYVLDTNTAIAAMNGIRAVRLRLSRVEANDVGIPLVAVAELIYGAHVSHRRDENLASLAALRRSIPTLALTEPIVGLTVARRKQERLRSAHRLHGSRSGRRARHGRSRAAGRNDGGSQGGELA